MPDELEEVLLEAANQRRQEDLLEGLLDVATKIHLVTEKYKDDKSEPLEEIRALLRPLL